MTPTGAGIDQKQTLAAAAAVMIDSCVFAVPVLADGRSLKGVVRRADIIRAVAEGRNPFEAKVGEFVRDEVPIRVDETLRVDESLERALAVMRQHGNDQLPVVEGQEVIGFVTRSDIEAYLRALGTPDQIDPMSEESYFGNAGPGEHSLRSHLRFLFSRLDVNCVLDIGANEGGFARLLRSFGYGGWIFSFEPVHGAFRQLNEASARDERWQALNLALGSRDEVRPIKVAQGSYFSSFLEPSDYGRRMFSWSTIVGEEEVTVRTLDSTVSQYLGTVGDRRTFLKADTQGWDLEVLRGATGALTEVVGVQLELSIKPLYEGAPGYREAIEYLEDRGFELTGLFPVVRDDWLRLIELDCVMIRTGGD